MNLKTRSASALLASCLVIQLITVIKDGYAVAMPVVTAHVQADEAPDTNIREDSTSYERLGAFRGINEDKLLEFEKTLTEGRQVIVQTERIIQGVKKENIVPASDGSYIKNETKVDTPRYSLSDEEFYLMAQVVEAEAGGEPYEGQIAVANVIFNRVKAGWGATVTEVINQKGQFTKKRKKPSDSVVDAIKEALYGRNAVPEGTLFFQNLEISTDFTVPETKDYVTKIGRHTFYK